MVSGVLVASLVMLRAGQHGPSVPEFTSRILEAKSGDMLVISGEVGSQLIEIGVNLAFEENFIREDLVKGEVVQDGQVTMPIRIGEHVAKAVRFRVLKGPAPDMVLSRKFFANRLVRWNIVENTLAVFAGGLARPGGFEFDFDSGVFRMFEQRFALPALSKDTQVWSNLQVPGSFYLFSARDFKDRSQEGEILVGLIANQLQTFIGRKILLDPRERYGKQFSLGFPGASFFGAQTVEIDFSHSKIFFDADPIHRGAYILGCRLELDFKVQDRRLVLVGSRRSATLESLRSMGIIGFYVESIGNVKLETSQLGDIIKIREYLLAIEKEKFMRLSDGEKTFTLRFE